MWAGGRLTWHRPVIVGRSFRRTSRVTDLREKDGRSGPLLFVTLRHEIADEDGVCLTDEADIVFRTPSGAASGTAAPTAPWAGDWSRRIVPDPVMLFRFSALTYNAHRIHYDRPYATEVEQYPGLLVQGPLIATLLLDLVRRNLPERGLATFRFRAVSPLFDTAAFDLLGKRTDDGCRVRAAAIDGRSAMEAEGTFAA